MNKKKYSQFANVCLAIGVASACVFDLGILPKSLVGSIGAIAGLGAICLYFCNSPVEEHLSVNSIEPVQSTEVEYESPSIPNVYFENSSSKGHMRNLRWSLDSKEKFLVKPEVELSSQEVAYYASVMMKELDASEGDWTFTFGPNGLTARNEKPASHYKNTYMNEYISEKYSFMPQE